MCGWVTHQQAHTGHARVQVSGLHSPQGAVMVHKTLPLRLRVRASDPGNRQQWTRAGPRRCGIHTYRTFILTCTHFMFVADQMMMS